MGLVSTVIERSGYTRSQLAKDAGLSRAALNSWTAGRREPQPESLRQLAAGLRRRAGVLEALAGELEGAAAE